MRPVSQRLGLTLGLVMAGASGLVPFESHADSPPGVMFLLDNHESMQDYPEYLPEAFTPGYEPPATPATRPGDRGGTGSGGLALNTGCDDPALVAAMSWFDKDSPDPAKNGSVIYDSDADLASPFFDPNRFYHSRGRRINFVVEESPATLYPDFESMASSSNTLTACYSSVGWDFNDYPYMATQIMDDCVRCLTTRGWWRGPIVTDALKPYQGPNQKPGEAPLPPEAFRKWVVSGRVLNVRPPKFVIARKALKDAIAAASNVRMGVATFGKDHGWYDPPELLASVRPSCDKSSPNIDEVALDRPLLMKAVNKTEFRNNERSTGEALFGLGGYFSSQGVDGKWANWFNQPINPGWGWPGCCSGGTSDNPYTGESGQNWGGASDEWIKPKSVDPATGYYRPGQPWEGSGTDRSVCSESQANAVIVVTGGRPHSDNSVPITRMMDILVADGARHADGSLLTFDPSNPQTNPNPGGVNYCHLFGSTQQACDYTDYNWPTGLATTNKNFMDDVAFFLSHADLRGDMPGNQSVRTFVVGYGDSSPMLQSISLAGKGQFFRADQPGELRDALLNALGEVSAGSTP
ncbi:hypothetical protein JQX13_49275 [Archangium violaceum]|uniref:hypothetical protein n=1 Tax=Archangium violaceum TaxID=83451 RepID=UPI00193C2568|nr:hypothetical protein [Archangium violaceum]QRK07882.1 hypothetical protein JQX13_49275 [Archangium violaceum]